MLAGARRGRLAAALVCLVALSAGAADDNARIAPYYPSPMSVVGAMLDAAELAPGELLIDLGSGDGRIVIVAAREFAARAVGYELDENLVASSRRRIREMELENLAEVRQQDLFTADLTEADVVTVYLLPRALRMLEPILAAKLKKGARVISHDFTFPTWQPDETLPIDTSEDDDGLPHSIYVYRR